MIYKQRKFIYKSMRKNRQLYTFAQKATSSPASSISCRKISCIAGDRGFVNWGDNNISHTVWSKGVQSTPTHQCNSSWVREKSRIPTRFSIIHTWLQRALRENLQRKNNVIVTLAIDSTPKLYHSQLFFWLFLNTFPFPHFHESVCDIGSSSRFFSEYKTKWLYPPLKTPCYQLYRSLFLKSPMVLARGVDLWANVVV